MQCYTLPVSHRCLPKITICYDVWSCCSTVQGVPAGARVVVVVVEVVVVVGGTQQRLLVSQDQPGNRRQLNVPGGQTLGVHGEVT